MKLGALCKNLSSQFVGINVLKNYEHKLLYRTRAMSFLDPDIRYTVVSPFPSFPRPLALFSSSSNALTSRYNQNKVTEIKM